jgi:hypothetical protein
MHATLATSPSETDWFTVDNTSFSMTQYQAQVQNTSTVTINNFNGNFVWIRGVIEMNDGAVQSILYNR